MSRLRCVVMSLVVLAACSHSDAQPAAEVEAPWSHADSGDPNGWWIGWTESLGGKAPFGPGTRFHTETVDIDGNYQTQVLEVESIAPGGLGTFKVRLRPSTGSPYNAEMPPALSYSPGPIGSLWTRSARLVPVTVPAGTFKAGRLWYGEKHRGGLVYERDTWVVPDLPIPVQSWSRPVSAEALYDPPADGTVPHGTILMRLVRIERR